MNKAQKNLKILELEFVLFSMVSEFKNLEEGNSEAR